jgi:hypothetical protein
MSDLILGIGSRVKHPKYGTGVVIQVWTDLYEITFIDHGTKQIAFPASDLEIVDYVSQDPDLVSFAKIERTMVRLLRRFSDIQEKADMAKKWTGGMMILKPSDPGILGKEIPIDTFFHKIVMVRDRLRVLEQHINSSNLGDDEKVELQQYITRIYGSLTSFNVLFAEKEDQFTGEKTK